MTTATIEGLEPRRNFGIIDEPRRKGGRNRRRDDRDGQGRGDRGGYGRKPRFEGRSDRFERSDRLEARGERFERQDRFDGRDRSERFDRGFDQPRFDSRERADRRERFGGSERRSFDRAERRTERDERFDRREKFGKDKPGFDKGAKSSGKPFAKARSPHRPKAVEEVFFAKRQAKKMRKFGDA